MDGDAMMFWNIVLTLVVAPALVGVQAVVWRGQTNPDITQSDPRDLCSAG